MRLNILFKALLSNKIKTALIYLSLLVTISSIFLISAVSGGIISMYSNMLQSDGDIIITQAKISDTFFSNVDTKIIKKIEKLENVQKVSALIVGASPVENLPIVAIYGASINNFPKYKLLKGAYPKKGEVIMGKAIFEQLTNKQKVQIANKKFNISGIFSSDIGFENGGIVMNLSDAGEIFHKSASMILVTCKLPSDNKKVMRKIRAMSKNIEVKSTNSFVKNYNQFKIISKSSFIISFVAFIMGLISIGSIMSITVMQRRDEFGIMKALGISTKKIVLSIMTEGVVIGIASFVSAYLLSNSILFVLKNIEKFQGYINGEINMNLVLYVFITTVFMTILGSLAPVYTALKVDPVTLIQRGN